jgi:hypothetical protein
MDTGKSRGYSQGRGGIQALQNRFIKAFRWPSPGVRPDALLAVAGERG